MATRTSKHLSFHNNELPRAIRNRIILLCGVFFLSCIIFYHILNHNPSVEISKMEAPDLPIISMQANGFSLNELHGYVHKMDACYMRDTITPIASDRTIHFTVSTDDVSDIAYELRSSDTTRKIANDKITDFSKEDGKLSASAVLANLLEENEEYLLVISLTVKDVPVYYYTHIIIPENEHIADCVNFAKNFHDTSLSADYSSLASYLETNYNAATDSLASVSITSTIDQVGWHGFHGSVAADPVLRIEDIGSDYVALTFSYPMKDNAEIPGYFNVEEYFKLRYASERFYLLDYQRTMNEIINPERFDVNENVLAIGVCDKNFTCVSNETGTIASFVQEGDLYEYNQNTDRLTRIFSFRGKDPIDIRANYGEHNIQILNIDENGSMDYVVYGYMNAGTHEGLCGMNLYHYNSADNSNTEKAFIISPKSYQVLHADFSELIYMDASNHFYIMTDGNLIKIDLDDLTTTELLSQMRDSQYAASASGRYIAWIEKSEADEQLNVMDLENESTITIKAENECDMVRPYAFLQDNLAYGLIHKNDIFKDAAGRSLYPTYNIAIRDITSKDGEILKDYTRDGVYISDVEATGYSLLMTLVKLEPYGYSVVGEDTIQNTSGEENRAITVSYGTRDTNLMITTVTMADVADDEEDHKLTTADSDLVLADSEHTFEVTTYDSLLHYYVYIGSHIELATTNLTEAITTADADMGIVVDTDSNYIWNRSRAPYVNAFNNLTPSSSDQNASSSVQCLSAMLNRDGESTEVSSLEKQGGTPLSILSSILKDDVVLDLTGCSIREVLYYVNIGSPVYAKTGPNDAVLLIGYDAANVIVYEPISDSNKKIALDDADAMFTEQGNVFISYIKNGEE